MIEFEDLRVESARIKVVGAGGGGGNAINNMISSGLLPNVEFIAANTDMQALKKNNAQIKLQLGQCLTRGLGAGACPEVGRESASESREDLSMMVDGADMVFITAGMGGGTGTGAAPIIAQAAKESGALTVAVVTKPFLFEGRRRLRQAEEGILALREAVDALIVIPNDRLMEVIGTRTSVGEAFMKVDEVLLNAVAGIAEVINEGGLVNVDFADVRAIMADTGPALMGAGRASGEQRALEAAQKAIASPLLENMSIEGATGILINVTGSRNLGLHEVQNAVAHIEQCAAEDANVIFGAVIDDEMGEEVKVTVIATGIETGANSRRDNRLALPATENRRVRDRNVRPPRRVTSEIHVQSNLDQPRQQRQQHAPQVAPYPPSMGHPVSAPGEVGPPHARQPRANQHYGAHQPMRESLQPTPSDDAHGRRSADARERYGYSQPIDSRAGQNRAPSVNDGPYPTPLAPTRATRAPAVPRQGEPRHTPVSSGKQELTEFNPWSDINTMGSPVFKPSKPALAAKSLPRKEEAHQDDDFDLVVESVESPSNVFRLRKKGY